MNNENTSLWDRFKLGMQLLKKPLVYFLVFLVIILQILPSDILPFNSGVYLYGTALIWLGYTLLEMLFEIHEKILNQRKELNIIESEKVFSEIKDIILGSKQKITNIKCIGVAGRNGWTNVIEKLTQENHEDSLLKNSIKFEIDLLLLDPATWEANGLAFRRINDYRNTIENINRRSDFINNSVTNDSYLNLHLYDHMPNVIGLLINDNYLFVTNSYWEVQEGEWVLRAGGTNHFVYDKNDDFGGQEVINRFMGWFNYILYSNETKKD